MSLGPLQWGRFTNEGIIVSKSAVTDTTPVVSTVVDMAARRGVSFQLITQSNVDAVLVTGSDGVVAGTKTFTFTGYTFTGKSGATLRISGATNAGNNGDFVITSVSSAHVVVCSGASGLVNETFSGAVQLQVIRTDQTQISGNWKIEVSNDYNPGVENSQALPGRWSDITSQFSPSIAPVTNVSNQYVQMDPIAAGACRVTFTPSAGTGTVSVCGFSKSNS